MNVEDLHPELAGFPAVVTLPVQWGDQDAFGHVNNTVPLRWFETSRIAYLERCGLAHYMSGRGVTPVVATLTCHYRRPIAYPDTVQVGTRLVRLAHASMTLGHLVCSLSQQTRTTSGETVVVFFDFEAGRPRRVPADVRERVLALQSGEVQFD
jgi:acyl-CoA thioester hydrolase